MKNQNNLVAVRQSPLFLKCCNTALALGLVMFYGKSLAQITVCDAARTGAVPLIASSENWLLRSDLSLKTDDLLVGAPLNLREKSLLSIFANTLKQQGTSVLVAPLPPRAIIAYSTDNKNNIPLGYSLDNATKAYNSYLSDLRKLGFQAVNPLERTTSDLNDYYFKRDHHWTPKGSLLTAELLQTSYAQLGFNLDPNRFKLKDRSVLYKYGTLASALEQNCGSKPSPEAYNSFTIEDTQQGSSLLGTEPIDAVIGTSNTDGLDLDFIANLKLLTGIDFVNGAVTGGANFGAWENWLTTSNETPARSIVWEQEYITMRYPSNNVDSILNKIPQLLPRITDTCPSPTDSLQLKANTFTPLNLSLQPRQFLKLELSNDQVRSLNIDRISGFLHNTTTMTKSTRIDNDRIFYNLNESEYTTYSNVQIQAPTDLTLKYRVCDAKIPEQYGVSELNPSSEGLDIIHTVDSNTYSQNLGELENGKYRWGTDHFVLSEFLFEPDRIADAKISFFNPIEGQNIEIFINGKKTDKFSNLKKGVTIQKDYFFRANKKNEILITYEKNNKSDAFAPNDRRSLGLLFNQWQVN